MQLSIRNVAERLHVSEKQIYRWIKYDALPSYRINDQVRLNRAELLEWATNRRMDVPQNLFYGPEKEGEVLPDLGEALVAGGIFYQVPGHDKLSLLRSIVACMPLPETVNREFMVRMLLAREALASTGVGDGIAIPHPRNPIVLHVPHPLVTLCFPETPVDFSALDRQPVSILFTLVSPTPRAHSHLLARLAHALRQPGFKALLIYQAPASEIHKELKRAELALPSHAVLGGMGVS